jgi:hypothetical protein
MHRIGDKVFIMETIAMINCNDEQHGRELAFEYFDGKFCTSYYNEQFDHADFIQWSPDIIEVNPQPEKQV